MKTPPILTAAFVSILAVTLVSVWGQEPSQSDPRSRDERPPAEEPRPLPDPGETESDDSPLDILRTAREKLIGYQSIQAAIVQNVAIGNRRFQASGNYLQGTDLKVRLEFQVQVGESQGALLEVCNGQVLWTRHQIGDEVRITRRDVGEILDAAAASPNVPRSMLIAELGLGGLPALLASIENVMTFDSVAQEMVGDRQFTVVEGTWNAQFRRQLTGDRGASARLPEYVPDAVRLYFDEENLFPRRLLYLKRSDPDAPLRKMVSLDFSKIVLNGPVNNSAFDFVPPDGVFPIDVTPLYLEQLKSSQTPNVE